MKDFFRSYAEEINSKFRRLNHLISHAPSIGNYHELILRSVLEKFLSKRCGIKTGFVLNRMKNTVSKQVDILIVDENDPAPYYFHEGDFVVVKPESVIMGIEVKTCLDKKQFVSAMNNSAQFRSTGNKAPFVVFAYSCDTSSGETLSTWYQAVEPGLDNTPNYPVCMYLLSRGALHLVTETIASPWGHYLVRPKDENFAIDTFVTSYFLSSVVKAGEVRAGKMTNPFEDFDMVDGIMEHYVYRFGRERAKASRIDDMIGNKGGS